MLGSLFMQLAPELRVAAQDLAIVAGTAGLSFGLGWFGDRLLHRRRRQAASAIWPMPSRSISVRAKGIASSSRAGRK